MTSELFENASGPLFLRSSLYNLENQERVLLSQYYYIIDVPGGNFLLARYYASTAFGFLVLKKYWYNTDTDILLSRLL